MSPLARSVFAVVIAVLGCTNAATAATIFASSANSSGTQNYGGSLGLDFTVGGQNIAVTRIGVFDDGANGLSLPINAYIYNFATQALVPGLGPIGFSTANSTLEPGTSYRFIDIPDVTLLAGVKYTLVADGYGDAEHNGNHNTGGPTISFAGSPDVTYNGNRFGGAGAYPGNVDVGAYAAGNFEFRIVPEPSSLTLLGSGVALFGLIDRRRRRRD